MPDCIADEPGAEALEQSDGGVDAWTVAMVVLGLALFINIVIFGLWVAYKWPWMKVGQVTSMNNAMTASQAKLKQLQDAASISSISISSDETEDDDVTSESDASEIFENKFVRDVP
uniref:Uncharacterized protein n=2 Tax=Ciona intestinalis TaxID=7719 RepID=H2XSH0_CIOIN